MPETKIDFYFQKTGKKNSAKKLPLKIF